MIYLELTTQLKTISMICLIFECKSVLAEVSNLEPESGLDQKSDMVFKISDPENLHFDHLLKFWNQFSLAHWKARRI